MDNYGNNRWLRIQEGHECSDPGLCRPGSEFTVLNTS